MKPILLLSDEPEIVRLMLKQVTSGGFFGARRCSAFLWPGAGYINSKLWRLNGEVTASDGKGYNCENISKKP